MFEFDHTHRSAKSSAQKRLLTREWIAIAVVFGILISTVFSSHLSKVRSDKALKICISEAARPIPVTLTGAIERPGTYLVTPGTTLKTLLQEVRLLNSAERKKVPFKKVFYAPQSIYIPKKKQGTPGE